LKISNGHISATHFIRFTLCMYTDHILCPAKTLDAYEIRHYLAREGNESSCVIKRKNETADLEK